MVLLEFNELNLACDKDYLRVYEEGKLLFNSSEFKDCKYENTGETIQSTSNNVSLVFVTDRSGTSSGWKITWRAIPRSGGEGYGGEL